MHMESFLRILAVSVFLSVVILGDFLYKRLYNPFYVRIMQIICWAASIVSVPFIILTARQTSRFIDSLIYHASISFGDIFHMVTSLLMVFFMIYGFVKYQLYYMRYDKKTIMTGWYIKQHSSMLKEKRYDDAYLYAQNTAELNPKSVFVWCHLALLSEYLMNTPAQSDEYFSKAKEVCDSCEQQTDGNKALIEHCIGKILQNRDNLQESLEHIKKAWELDPVPYYKKEYEEAVELMNENNSDSTESE